MAFLGILITVSYQKKKPNGLGAEMAESFQKFFSLLARSHHGCFKLEKWLQQYQETNVSEKHSINYICSHWYMYYCDVKDGQPCLCLFSSTYNLFNKSEHSQHNQRTQRLFRAHLSLFLAYRIVVYLKWFFFQIKKVTPSDKYHQHFWRLYFLE